MGIGLKSTGFAIAAALLATTAVAQDRVLSRKTAF